jgi:polyisoprenoid-binding protein YceI
MATATQIPGYVVGTWNIDPVHTDVSFTVRHMMVSKVRGRFETFAGQFVTAEDPTQSSVTATVDLTSINTNNVDRDNHIRSADFFEVESHPQMTFRSTAVRAHGHDWLLDGALTLHGITRPITFELEVNGFAKDPMGGTRVGFSASSEINRKDFDINTNIPMDGGGVVIGEKVQIHLEVEAVLEQPSA